MLTYDPRRISVKVYSNLNQVKQTATSTQQQEEQKSQAIELYTYTATWGLLRLKGEEPALSNQPQKRAIIECFFKTLGELAYSDETPNPLDGQDSGLNKLISLQASEYLGLSGLALQIAQEFSFWAEALYPRRERIAVVSTITGE